ncbi:MAG: rhamnulokinase [Clostridia bacterium]|nr:rhamnulokinase [Clostridia bacterium]
MQRFLAIDIGASGGRHIVGYIEDGRIVTREVYRFSNGMVQKGDHLCWDLESLESHVIAGLRAAAEQGLRPDYIGIDTWGVDYVMLKSDGQVLGQAVAYRDHRTDGADEALEKTLSFPDLFRLTGIAKQPFNTVYQFASIKADPQSAFLLDAADDFLLMPEYLSYVLTGIKKHEWTNASTTAMCSPVTRTWSKEVIQALDMPEKLFDTEMVMPGTLLGTVSADVAEKIGYTASVILPATHDTGSAYMAVPARDSRSVFLSSGTWSLLGCELSEPILTDTAREAGFTNEGGWGGSIRFLKNIMGMWMLQCLRHEDQDRLSYAEMAELAAKSTYEGFVDASDNRFLSPQSMTEEVKAALRSDGYPEPKDFGDLCRAVTVGLARCYRQAIGDLQKIIGREFTSINIVGGGSQNVTLNQLTADLTGLPVLAGPTEGTALGNLGAQMIACGVFPSLQSFRDCLARSCDVVEYTKRG